MTPMTTQQPNTDPSGHTSKVDTCSASTVAARVLDLIAADQNISEAFRLAIMRGSDRWIELRDETRADEIRDAIYAGAQE